MSRDICVAFTCDAIGLTAVCDCGISWSYSQVVYYFTYKSYTATHSAGCCPFWGGDWMVVDSLFGVASIVWRDGVELGPFLKL